MKNIFPITVDLKIDWSPYTERGTPYLVYFDTSGSKRIRLKKLTRRLDFYIFGRNDIEAIRNAETEKQKAQTEVNERGPQHEIWKRDFIAFYIKVMLEQKTESTQRTYNTVKNHLRKFMVSSMLNPDVLPFQKLDDFMVCEMKKFFKKCTKNPNSGRQYFSKIIHVIGCAQRHGFTRHYISSAQIDEGPTEEKNMLTVEQLEILWNTPCENDEVKRAFLFNHFVGLRYGDLQVVAFSHIVKSIGNEYILKLKTGKNGVWIRNHIRPDIFKLFVEPGTGDARLFPGLAGITDGDFNKVVNKWLEAAGIDIYITSHCSRKFYGDTIYQHTKDELLKEKALGHVMKTTGSKFYGNVSDEDLKQATLMLYVHVNFQNTRDINKAV